MSAQVPPTPQEFAQAVLDAFVRARRYNDEQVGGAGGPSTTTMTKYRKVAAGTETMGTPRGDSFQSIDRAAKWRPGSAEAFWRTGALPTPGDIADEIRNSNLSPESKAAILAALKHRATPKGEKIIEGEEIA